MDGGIGASRNVTNQMLLRTSQSRARELLDRAARLAIRGHGAVEPNPMVGCVLLAADGSIVSVAHHRAVGGDHAEAAALSHAGERARGGTALVTLEPCNHHGRTPPCSLALCRAGVREVIFGECDANPAAAGGAEQLRSAGIDAWQCSTDLTRWLHAPFLLRVREQRPWVIAKWAQDCTGATAAHDGTDRWISSPRSRAMVHRERARVDAVLVGIGTVLHDDPHLLPHTCSRRRTPVRAVIDPFLSVPLDSKLVRTVADGPVTVLTSVEALTTRSNEAEQLRRAGVVVRPLDLQTGRSSPLRGVAMEQLRTCLEALGSDGVSTVLCEGGARLIGALLAADLVDDAWVFSSSHALDRAAADPKRITLPHEGTFALHASVTRCSDRVEFWRRMRQRD